MSGREDHELAAAAARGDDGAFEALVRRHGRIIGYLVRTYSLPGGDDDDVRQEVLIGVHHACARFRPDAGMSFRTFARMVAERRVQTELKNARRGKRRVLSEAARLDAPIQSGSDVTLGHVLRLPQSEEPPAVVARREDMRRIALLPERLSERERDVLARWLNGASYDEIGERKSIDNTLQRVRRKARELLAD